MLLVREFFLVVKMYFVEMKRLGLVYTVVLITPTIISWSHDYRWAKETFRSLFL